MTHEIFIDLHRQKGYERGMTFMGKKKASEETGRVPANQNFHLSEAFFGTLDSIKSTIVNTKSMNELAPAMLSAKSVEEVVSICRQISLNEWSFGRDGSLLAPAIEFLRRKRMLSDDPVPFYAQWIFITAQTVAATLDLYTICLRVIRGESNKSPVSNILDMLYVADRVSQQMRSEIDGKKKMLCGLSNEYVALQFDYRNIPRFPLMSILRDLQSEHGEYLQQKYGITYYQRKLGEEFRYHYWNNPNAEREVKDLLWDYAIKPCEEDTKCLLMFDDRTLAEKILGLLDQHTEQRLSDGVRIKINSVAGETNAVSWHIDTALFLWVFTQIRNTEEYRLCKICGQVFKVGSQKTRQYCDSHKKAAIDYFNKKIRKQQEAEEYEYTQSIVV